MARIRLYVATSLDGFIADGDGSVDWMAPYDARLYGYEKFLAEVGALVMGRRTFEMINATGEEWPYQGRTVFVLTSEPLSGLPRGVVTSGRGMLSALQQARETTQKDIWIMGGAVTLQSALEEGLVDLVEMFLVPGPARQRPHLAQRSSPSPVAPIRWHRGVPRRGRQVALYRAEGRSGAGTGLSLQARFASRVERARRGAGGGGEEACN